MRSGLLWYDASTNDLTVKIAQAATRYQQKFGVRPNRAFVHPSDMPAAQPAAIEAKGIVIETKHTILPKHIWIGVDESLDVAHAQG